MRVIMSLLGLFGPPATAHSAHGAEEAAGLIGEGWPTWIVTLQAMSGDVVGAHHLYVVVDDVTTVTDERHPTSTHLQQVLDFTRDLTDRDRLLVHCKGVPWCDALH
jgi:hypothetical protein